MPRALPSWLAPSVPAVGLQKTHGRLSEGLDMAGGLYSGFGRALGAPLSSLALLAGSAAAAARMEA